jgi:hypothetical protein
MDASLNNIFSSIYNSDISQNNIISNNFLNNIFQEIVTSMPIQPRPQRATHQQRMEVIRRRRARDLHVEEPGEEEPAEEDSAEEDSAEEDSAEEDSAEEDQYNNPIFTNFENTVLVPMMTDNIMNILNTSSLNSSTSGGGINTLASILNQTLYQKPKYIKVLSEEGKEKLKTSKYSPDLDCNNSCPIMQLEFEPEEEVIILPCNHAFNPEGITHWLEKEKAECPICRYQLDSIEKKVESNRNQEDVQNTRQRLQTVLNNSYTIPSFIPVNSSVPPTEDSHSSDSAPPAPHTTPTQSPLNNQMQNMINVMMEQQEEDELHQAMVESRRLYEEEQEQIQNQNQISSISKSDGDESDASS